MENEVISVNQIRTPLIRVGNRQSSESIVFLHGNPGSSRDWINLLEHVGNFARAIAPDMPGFGQADKPADFDYTVGGYAKHLDRLLSAENIERVHLVLHDFGGPWGLEWASKNAARVGSITLLNMGINPGYRWHYMAKIWRTPILGELFMATSNRPSLKMALKHGNPRGLPNAYFDEMYKNFDAGTKRAVLKLYRNTNSLGDLADGWAHALAPHKIPAAVVWGAADPYVPVRFAEMQRQFFDVKSMTHLADSGHWPMIDHPDAVRDAVVPFLSAHFGV